MIICSGALERRELTELGRLLDASVVHVAIDITFPFAEAREVHQRAARGHLRGKIVLTVGCGRAIRDLSIC